MSNADIGGVDYGPLAALIGEWQGNAGTDIAPEPDGDEHNSYYEQIIFEAAGDVTNAEQQTLAILRYHQEVRRISTDKVFHDQVGYWLWEAATDQIIQTLTIPRGVTLLAGGSANIENGTTVFEVSAAQNSADWPIIQAPFMQAKARTTHFSHRIELSGDSLFYREVTTVDIYGKSAYPHSDENRLTRQ